jgi:hypothetical protein
MTTASVVLAHKNKSKSSIPSTKYPSTIETFDHSKNLRGELGMLGMQSYDHLDDEEIPNHEVLKSSEQYECFFRQVENSLDASSSLNDVKNEDRGFWKLDSKADWKPKELVMTEQNLFIILLKENNTKYEIVGMIPLHEVEKVTKLE